MSAKLHFYLLRWRIYIVSAGVIAALGCIVDGLFHSRAVLRMYWQGAHRKPGRYWKHWPKGVG